MARSLAANLYNPHEQSKEELIARFVARQELFHEVYQALQTAELGQHDLLEGQRGMGKTTLLLRLCYALENDPAWHGRVIPLALKEEAYYGIRHPLQLWETVAVELAGKDQRFTGLLQAVDHHAADAQTMLTAILDVLAEHDASLALFIDNIGEIIKNFTAAENADLHEFLLTTPVVHLVGATPVALEAILPPGNVFRDFFRKHQLVGLTKAETYDLLQELANTAGQTETMQMLLQRQPGRVESLRLLTGGVIRTIVLLFEVFMEQEDGDTVTDLDVVLDRVTPLYKSRLDELTPSQREFVHTLALHWEALDAEELRRKTRLSADEVNAGLQELEYLFMIEQIAGPGQLPLYRLRERFLNIWYLMRLASGSHQARVVWLLHFLESWYNQAEFGQHAKQHLASIMHQTAQAKAAYYLTEAFVYSGQLDNETEHQMLEATRSLLQSTDTWLAEQLSPSEKSLFEQAEVLYRREAYQEAIAQFLRLTHPNKHIQFRLGWAYWQIGNLQEAAVWLTRAAERGHVEAMVQLGQLAQAHLHDPRQAERWYRAAGLKGRVDAQLYLGNLYAHALRDPANAEQAYLAALKEARVRAGILSSGSFSLKGLKNYLVTALKGDNEDAELYPSDDFPAVQKNYLAVIQTAAAETLFQLGHLYAAALNNVPQAQSMYEQAVEAGHAGAVLALADLYAEHLRDAKKAEKYYLQAAAQKNIQAYAALGFFYHQTLHHPKKAEKYYLLAAEQGDVRAMNGLAWLYFEQKRQKARALTYIQQTLNAEQKQNMYTAHTAACIYLWNDQMEDAADFAQIFMFAPEAYETLSQDILFYLLLLLAKGQYEQVQTYFAAPQLRLAERFAPLFYALLYLRKDAQYRKLPPELSLPVKDLLKQVTQLARDYA